VALPIDIEKRGLPICHAATDQGCVMTWNSVQTGHVDHRRLDEAVIWWDGRYQPIAGRALVCVNPLNWTVNGRAPPSANLGGVYGKGSFASDNPIPPPVPGVTGASCEDGLLGVDVVADQRQNFSDLMTLIGIYHDFDYGLFYMNIRENAVVRARGGT